MYFAVSLRVYCSCAPAIFNIVNDVNYAVIHSVPMKRLGSIDEVLKSVAYLLSDDSSYSTGTNLVIDGGLSCGLKA
jgi:3alpha(or 20beta)-hydroxysteroid dehydrogenase